MVLSFSVHRINSAFLFSVLSKKRKVQLALQFVPGKAVVHLGPRNSVSFDYDVHDGQWHTLALDFQGDHLFFYAFCGKKSVHIDLHLNKEELLDPEGYFLLGKMNQNSVTFEGAICQFDIYPSAKAAHNYCDYIKKHCRAADTYRPVLPPLLPLFSTDPNITFTQKSPLSGMKLAGRGQGPTLASTEKNTRTTKRVPTDQVLMQNKTSGFPTVNPPELGAITVPTPVVTGLESPSNFPTQTVTPSLRLNVRTPKPTDTKQGDTNFLKPSGTSTDLPPSARTFKMEPDLQTIAAPTQWSLSYTAAQQAAKKPEPKVTGVQDVGPTGIIPVTPAATDGFQTFDQEPTHYSLLAAPPGLKGEPGPPVSV